MPACYIDTYMYRLHKRSGGNFQNYQDKSYLEYTDEQIAKHLNGKQTVGIYPLLKDNTSWFLAADFDKDKWEEECKIYINACKEFNISAYLERSRSGKGGHVWVFFDKPYPAVKSRIIFIHILEQTGIFSKFDKSSSFDRLFPNQDYLAGKGFGNLIALPLQKEPLELGNSCFIDIETFKPYINQWEFLNNIERININDLDKIYNKTVKQNVRIINASNPELELSEKLTISLSSDVKISRSGLTPQLVSFIKEELNFINTEYIIKKKLSKNTWGTERYFNFVEESEQSIILPRGTIGKILRFCKEHKIEHEFRDERQKLIPVNYSDNIYLKEHQQNVIEITSRKDIGVIVAPPGSGKTIIALKIIAEKKQPTLIIVHRKQIAEQWIERIQTFLGIPKSEIGKIGQGKSKIGEKITVAMIQSLSKIINNVSNEKINDSFGTIIVDECHHIPAESFRDTISKLNTFYLYGLTATPFRKYNDGKLIFIHLGEVISEIKSQNIISYNKPQIIIKNTELDIPFNSKTDKFETLSKVLVHDSSRNKIILDDMIKELKIGKKVIVITERKEHIDSLNQYLKQSYETITLYGEDSENSRNYKWKILKEGNY